MPNLEIEYDEATGKIGTLPEPLQKFVDSMINQRNGETRKKIEAELADKYKTAAPDAAERERLKLLEDENQRYKTADAERKAEYEKALKIREEAEQKREAERAAKDAEREKEIQRRDGRLRDMARTEIKIAAKKLGARDESLDELGKLLGADLDLDADLNAFVKGADGKPLAGKDGNPVTIEGHVKAYLDTHPHHRASTAGTGGGARGGANLEHLSGPVKAAQQKVNEAEEALEKNPHSNVLVNQLLEAERALKQAQAAR